jgi:hypothetical protein
MIKNVHYTRSKNTGKLFLRLVKNHVMKAYGAGSTAPHILTFFTRCAKKKIEKVTQALALLDTESTFYH